MHGERERAEREHSNWIIRKTREYSVNDKLSIRERSSRAQFPV